MFRYQSTTTKSMNTYNNGDDDIVRFLPNEWTFGTKTLRCPKRLIKELKLPIRFVRERRDEGSGDLIVRVDIVKFIPSSGYFHGYVVDRDTSTSIQRRLWIRLKRRRKDSLVYVIERVGVMKTERSFRFGTIKHMSSRGTILDTLPRKKRKRSSLRISYDRTKIKMPSETKRPRRRTFGKRTSTRSAATRTTTTKGSERHVVSTIAKVSSNRWMGLPMASTCVSPPSSPSVALLSMPAISPPPTSADTEVSDPATPLFVSSASPPRGLNRPGEIEEDATVAALLSGVIMREIDRDAADRERNTSNERRMPSDHDVVLVADEEHLEELRRLTIENFETTRSIPTPDPPIPTTTRSNSLFATWRTKTQRSALLRCRCDPRRPATVGYISWIEIEPARPGTFVSPPAITQVYVSATHRGSSAPHGGHFGRRMLEWLVALLRSKCEIVIVANPNVYSRQMLRDCGWHEAQMNSLPENARAAGTMYARFQKHSLSL